MPEAPKLITLNPRLRLARALLLVPEGTQPPPALYRKPISDMTGEELNRLIEWYEQKSKKTPSP